MGFPNPLTVVVLFILFLAVPAVIITLLIFGLAAYRHQHRRRGHGLVCGAFAIATLAWGGFAYQFPSAKKISLSADLTVAPNIGDNPKPTDQRTLANGVTQRFYSGDVTVRITLPDGKTVTGRSGHVTAYDAKGRFAGISLFIIPSDAFTDYLAYWVDGGTVLSKSDDNDRITIQRAGYRVFYDAPNGPTPPEIDIRAGDYASLLYPELIVYGKAPK